MKSDLRKNQKIIVAAFFVAGIVFLLISFGREKIRAEYYSPAIEAVKAQSEALCYLDSLFAGAVHNSTHSKIPGKSLIGEDFSEITTTVGYLDSKISSLNPSFAALIVKYISDLKIKNKEKIGIIASGSFPALTIAALAACEKLGHNVIMVSSIGASSFGANNPLLTWADMEYSLYSAGRIHSRSRLLTPGGDDDLKAGLFENSLSLAELAAERTNSKMFIPKDFEDAKRIRREIFDEEKIALLINIGGNETALGKCAHSSQIPNGIIDEVICRHHDRGLIAEYSGRIHVINLLNIKQLAQSNGINESGLFSPSDLESVVYTNKYNKFLAVTGLLATIFLLIKFR